MTSEELKYIELFPENDLLHLNEFKQYRQLLPIDVFAWSNINVLTDDVKKALYKRLFKDTRPLYLDPNDSTYKPISWYNLPNLLNIQVVPKFIADAERYLVSETVGELIDKNQNDESVNSEYINTRFMGIKGMECGELRAAAFTMRGSAFSVSLSIKVFDNDTGGILSQDAYSTSIMRFGLSIDVNGFLNINAGSEINTVEKIINDGNIYDINIYIPAANTGIKVSINGEDQPVLNNVVGITIGPRAPFIVGATYNIDTDPLNCNLWDIVFTNENSIPYITTLIPTPALRCACVSDDGISYDVYTFDGYPAIDLIYTKNYGSKMLQLNGAAYSKPDIYKIGDYEDVVEPISVVNCSVSKSTDYSYSNLHSLKATSTLTSTGESYFYFHLWDLQQLIFYNRYDVTLSVYIPDTNIVVNTLTLQASGVNDTIISTKGSWQTIELKDIFIDSSTFLKFILGGSTTSTESVYIDLVSIINIRDQFCVNPNDSIILNENANIPAVKDYINRTPIKFHLYNTGDSLLSDLIFDKSNSTYWKDSIRNLHTYDESNPGVWDVDELDQDFIWLHIQDPYRYFIFINRTIDILKEIIVMEQPLTLPNDGDTICTLKSYIGKGETYTDVVYEENKYACQSDVVVY